MTTSTRAQRAHGRQVRALDEKGLAFSPMAVARYVAGAHPSRLLCPFEIVALAVLVDYARRESWGCAWAPGDVFDADKLYQLHCPLTGRIIYLEGYGLIEDGQTAVDVIRADRAAVERLAAAGFAIHSDGIEHRTPEVE